MKKLLKKKLNLFGKEFSVLVVGLFAIALVSAALVPYLSGTVEALFRVDHPMLLEVSKDGSAWGDSIDLRDTYSGSEFSYKVRSTYRGEEQIDMKIVTNIGNTIDNATCEDFKDLIIISPTDLDVDGDGTNDLPAGTQINLIDVGLCQDNNGIIEIAIPARFGYSEGDKIQVYDVSGTFAINVQPASYTVETQAMMPVTPAP